MNPISVNGEECIKCLKCIGDCPNSYLFFEDGEIQTSERGCMECGHCYAICPGCHIHEQLRFFTRKGRFNGRN